MSYIYRINVTPFKILNSDEAELANMKFGKIGQNGIRYPETLENSIVFSSHSASDLLDALERGYWDHTSRAARVKIGDTIFIKVNQKESNRLQSQFIIKALVSSLPEKVNPANSNWSSDVNNNPTLLVEKAIDIENNQ